MLNAKWLNLQLFAGEGAGDGGADGATSGVTADADAGHQRLLELGVPKDKLRKRAYNIPKPKEGERPAPAAAKEDAKQDAAATDTPTEEKNNEAKSEDPSPAPPKRLSWDEIMQDPEYKGEMQKLIQKRLKDTDGIRENASKMELAHAMLAKAYGLDAKNIDYDALSKKITDDAKRYEEKGLTMGVSAETAMMLERKEAEADLEARRENERKQAEAMTLERKKLREHIEKVNAQGEELKKIFPSFDLAKEMKNPVFARLTAPSLGFSVEDAYYHVHRKEIQETAMKVAADEAVKKYANAVRSGSTRPSENGSSSKGSSVDSFNYRNATKQEREALKARIRSAAAKGEKIYPGK